RFYRDLGRQKIKERPRDAQAHLELGLVEMDNFGNLDEALFLFHRACEINTKFSVAWFFHGVVLFRKKQFGEALRSFAQAERLGHRTALVAESQADAYYNSGQFSQAAKSYEAALRREAQNPLIESKLGLAKIRCGESDAGLSSLYHARETQP